MTTVTPDSVFRRSPNATHQTVAGEAILIDLNTGSYYSLNETGTWLWEHLDGKRTVGELASELAAVCNISDQVDVIKGDVIELLTDLTREKLVLQA